MTPENLKTYRSIEKLLKRLNEYTYECQGEIFNSCSFPEKQREMDARVAIMGFIRGEIIATYFQFTNLLKADNNNQILDEIKGEIGEVAIPNGALLELLKSNMRMNFANNIYSLLESGHRKFYPGGNFKDYKSKFNSKHLKGHEILRHLRNSMHNNGVYKPTDKKSFICTYRNYELHYKNGDFLRYNYMLIYWIIRDSLNLFKEMALDNLKVNPDFLSIDQEYNITNFGSK